MARVDRHESVDSPGSYQDRRESVDSPGGYQDITAAVPASLTEPVGKNIKAYLGDRSRERRI